jgi:preprotein translocase subunit SecE
MAEPKEQRKKRVVKNPETFRERAVKAVEASDKPKRTHRVRRGITKLLRPIFSPIARGWHWLFRHQPFKFIAKIFRWIGLVVFPPYFRNSWMELRKVTWPNWKQSRSLTFAVLVFAFVFGALVAVVDYGLDKVFKAILLK